ncbi:MAG: hypothetical protein AUK47_24875 [Deltaproteobacteria bacterium CG2_30_63_29]|nr:MAG: hypothetical protein AUK47_24875 [Deltaproteobacteria bacterium CG2_30_63_29]
MNRRVRTTGFLSLLLAILLTCVACPKDPQVETPTTEQPDADPKTKSRNALETDPDIIALLGEGLSAGNVGMGRELFAYKCDNCHESTEVFAANSWTRPQLVAEVGVIRDGRAAMPGFGSRLTGQQILDIVVALLTP